MSILLIGMVTFGVLLFITLLLSYIIGWIFSKIYHPYVERTTTDHVSNGGLVLLITLAIPTVMVLFFVLGVLVTGGSL